MNKFTYSTLILLAGFSASTVIAEPMATEQAAAMETMPQHSEQEAMAMEQETQAIEEGGIDTEMATQTAADMEGFSRGSVVRSIFTSAIDEREPTDNLKELANINDKVIYYTELRDMTGQKAIHRWEYNGEVMAEIEFNVKGPRWRVWSSKSFVPQWTGEWKVSVLNGANEVISEDILNYIKAGEALGEAAGSVEGMESTTSQP